METAEISGPAEPSYQLPLQQIHLIHVPRDLSFYSCGVMNCSFLFVWVAGDLNQHNLQTRTTKRSENV